MNQEFLGRMSIIIVSVCSFRFLFDGISLSLFGHCMKVGHTDPMAYSSMMAPILAAHGYVHVKTYMNGADKLKQVDNPDQGAN